MPMLCLRSIPSLPDLQWQKAPVFPDWKGYVDDTLAMNSMFTFRFWRGQGTLYLSVDPRVTGFRMRVNDSPVDTRPVAGGYWALDFAEAAVDGANTLLLGCIEPAGLRDAVKVFLPFPEVLPGGGSMEGIRPEALRFIDRIVSEDVKEGFPAAQLAVVRHGRLVFEKAWGRVRTYEADGSRSPDPTPATVDTLFDLASITKMAATNFSLMKLVTEGRLDLDAPVVSLLGDAFAEHTLPFRYEGGWQADGAAMRAAKARLTVRDLLCHHSGFPPDPRYPNLYMDAPRRRFDPKAVNPLFGGCDGSEETRRATLQAIFKTPLLYEPGTQTAYSDVNYMLLGFIIERLTGQRLDRYFEETFARPLGLRRLLFRPLDKGFAPGDCAATELCGNTRDGAWVYPGVRTHTLQGEVHDEKASRSLGGVAGHAGLFGCARELTILASSLLTGGYGGKRFFSRAVIDWFCTPKSAPMDQWGLGWMRMGDDRRPWYYGTQAGSHTVGHQGWTGTLLMVDPERDLVIAYLTNKIHSPITRREDPNRFNGSWMTAGTLGFVPQILSIGLDRDADIRGTLIDLAEDMLRESRKLLPEGVGEDDDHPAARNVRSKARVLQWLGESHWARE